jgi:hypothetical protein
VYINHIDTLVFQYNYTINAIAQGHELKSRAHFNLIRYNFIGNLSTNDSRNIDLPNGGTAILVGNVIEQSEASVNSNIVGYGLEGLTNTGPHNLWIVNNTFVNRKSKGSFVQVNDLTDTLLMKNNILVGKKTGGLLIGTPSHLDSSHNVISDDIVTAGFVNAGLTNYHLTNASICVNRGTDNLPIVRYNLTPKQEYTDTASAVERKRFGRIDIGAYEFKGNANVPVFTETAIAIYPNPVVGSLLYYNAFETTPFHLVSLEGKTVYTGLFEAGRCQLTGIPNGLYVIVIGNSRKLLLVE